MIATLFVKKIMRKPKFKHLSLRTIISVLLKNLKLIALALQPFYGSWQCIEQFVVAFYRIVKGNNASVSCIASHIEQDVASVKASRIVTRNEVPHHYFITHHNHDVLLPLHPTMRRTKEVCVQIFVSLVYIAHIRAYAVQQSAYVVVSVVAQSVPAAFNHLELLGVLAYVVAHHKEGGFDAVVVEHVKHPGCHLGYGAVVESEVNGPFVLVHAPQGARVQPAQYAGRLFDYHGCLVCFRYYTKRVWRLRAMCAGLCCCKIAKPWRWYGCASPYAV